MKSLRIKYFKKLIIASMLIGAVYGLLVWANMPKKGSILNAPNSNRASNKYTDLTLDGTNFKFQYSSSFNLKQEVASNGDVERYTLIADTRYDKRILASVAELSDGRLESNGAYIFRQNSSNYSNRKVKAGSEMATVWVKKDGTEQTAIIHNGKQAALISFVTSNINDNLTKDIDTLLSTFQWKQTSANKDKQV